MIRAIVCALALGGCGSTIDAKQHLTTVCEAAGAIRTEVDLPVLDLKAVRPADGMVVEVRADSDKGGFQPLVLVDPSTQRSDPSTETYDRVLRALKNERLLRDLREDKSPPVPALVIADKAAASEQVAQALAALQTGGVTEVQFVVASTVQHVLPAYPDPAFAAELKGKLAAGSQEQRQSVAAKIISDELALCPAGQEAFAAIGMATREQRCSMIAYGLGEALPSCYATSTSRVVTALHVITEPTIPTQLTQFSVRLSPDGEALNLAGPLWSDAAKPLAALAGKALNAVPSTAIAE